MVLASTRTWLITWTTKGTWLPGDRRGWFLDEKQEQKNLEKGNWNPQALELLSREKMKSPPIWLNQD